MERSNRFRNTLRQIYAHWPAYFGAYGGVVLALIFIGVSAERGWLAFVPITLAVLLLFVYFLSGSLWATNKQYGPNGIRPHHILFEMSQVKATDTFVYIDLGLRQPGFDLSRRLTTGQVIMIDVYNIQWTAGRALARHRSHIPPLPSDPRIIWCDGDINLLPLPDNSVPAVILYQVASQFWQQGDRLALLREVCRILAPNGRILIAERVRSQLNWLIMGPAALTLPHAHYWRTLLTEAGFRLRNERDLQGLIHCFRADKPTPAEAQQLAFDLN